MAATLKVDTIKNASSAVDNITLDASGNVNIGTSAVAVRLYVSGNSAQSISALGSLSGTITLDLSTANDFSVTLVGNSTLANPSNVTAGQSGIIFVSQDATGSRTLAYGTYWDWPNQSAPSLTTTASAVDVIVWTARTTTSIVAQIVPNIG